MDITINLNDGCSVSINASDNCSDGINNDAKICYSYFQLRLCYYLIKVIKEQKWVS